MHATNNTSNATAKDTPENILEKKLDRVMNRATRSCSSSSSLSLSGPTCFVDNADTDMERSMESASCAIKDLSRCTTTPTSP